MDCARALRALRPGARARLAPSVGRLRTEAGQGRRRNVHFMLMQIALQAGNNLLGFTVIFFLLMETYSYNYIPP